MFFLILLTDSLSGEGEGKVPGVEVADVVERAVLPARVGRGRALHDVGEGRVLRLEHALHALRVAQHEAATRVLLGGLRDLGVELLVQRELGTLEGIRERVILVVF